MALFDLDTGDFTLEVWFKRRGLPVGDYFGLISKFGSVSGTGPDGAAWILASNISGTGVDFTVQRANASYDSVIVANCLPLDAWTHVVATKKGETGSIYINGVLRSTGTIRSPLVASVPIAIGSYSNGVHKAVGDLAHPAIYDRALSAAEIKSHFLYGAQSRSKPRLIVEDNFTGAAATAMSGRAAETGQVWTETSGAWQLDGSGGGRPTTGQPSVRMLTLAPGQMLSAIEAKLVSGADGSPTWRVQDINNRFLLALSGSTEIWKMISGVKTVLASGITASVAGTVERLEFSGNTMTLFKNGVQVAQVTDSALNTVQTVGLAVYENTVYDYFRGWVPA